MRRTRGLPLLVLAAGLLASTTIGLAQDPGLRVASYLQGLARIRGVSIPPAPKIVTRTDEETRQLLVAGLDRGLPPNWWDSQEKALRKFALIHVLQNALFDAKGFVDLGPGRGDEALARRAVLDHQGCHVLILEGVSPDREPTVRDAVWRSRPLP